MKTTLTLIAALCLLHAMSLQAQVIPFTSDRWTIEAQGHIIDAYEGMQNAMLLQGGKAWINDLNFKNGIIEFDLYLSERRGFPGVMFRMQDDNNYEEFYIRPHLSGMPDAMQYTPVYGANSAWQLYHDQSEFVNDGEISFKMKEWDGFNTVYTYPYDRWLHVKLVISGARADVYFDHEEKPALQIRELRRGISGGGVGIKTGVSPFYFANFTVTPMENGDLTPMHPWVSTIDQHRITKWQISSLLEETQLNNAYKIQQSVLDTLTWDTADAENSGVVNISALRALTNRKLNTVLAKITLNSQGDRTKRLDFGYSDRVKVYCNGQLIYSGDNSYLTRDYRYLGTIGYFDSVYLPLKNGRNEIVLAVSETFGGWGVQGRLENIDGILVE